jgi:hypothetical protein
VQTIPELVSAITATGLAVTSAPAPVKNTVTVTCVLGEHTPKDALDKLLPIASASGLKCHVSFFPSSTVASSAFVITVTAPAAAPAVAVPERKKTR